METMHADVLKTYDLTGKIALVTGSQGGLGRRISWILAAAGASVVLVDRNQIGVEDLVAEIQKLNQQYLVVTADISQPPEISQMIRQTLDVFGRLDIAVNCAGVNIRKPALEFTEEDFDKIVGVNLKGLFHCCQEEGRVMVRQRWGRIINISSLASEIGYPHRAVYAASKSGVTGLTRVLAAEWAPHAVTVNCIGPGHMLTPLTAKVFQDSAMVDELVARIPTGRLGTPSDLDGAVVFLASDSSQYFTGQTLYVDGGYLLNDGWHSKPTHSTNTPANG